MGNNRRSSILDVIVLVLWQGSGLVRMHECLKILSLIDFVLLFLISGCRYIQDPIIRYVIRTILIAGVVTLVFVNGQSSLTLRCQLSEFALVANKYFWRVNVVKKLNVFVFSLACSYRNLFTTKSTMPWYQSIKTHLITTCFKYAIEIIMKIRWQYIKRVNYTSLQVYKCSKLYLRRQETVRKDIYCCFTTNWKCCLELIPLTNHPRLITVNAYIRNVRFTCPTTSYTPPKT